MPHIKNALIRYRIIDKCIRNKYNPFPTKRDLREACEESLFGSIDGNHICDSTIEKDMFAMRMEHDAPIKYSKLECTRLLYMHKEMVWWGIFPT